MKLGRTPAAGSSDLPHSPPGCCHQRTHPTARAIAGALLVFNLLLAACSSNPLVRTVIVTQQVTLPAEQVIVTATPPAPTPPPPTPQPQPVETAVIALQNEPATLHPLLGTQPEKETILGAIHLGCLGQNDQAEWITRGCRRVPTLENGGAVFLDQGADEYLEVIYRIADGWRWADGTPVTARDAVYWWFLQMQPDFPIVDRSAIQKLYSVDAMDEQTIRVRYLSENQVRAAYGEVIPADESRACPPGLAYDSELQGCTLVPVNTEFGSVDHSLFESDYYRSYCGSCLMGQPFDSPGNVGQTYAGKGPLTDPVYWSLINWLPSHVLSQIPPAEQGRSKYARKPLGDGPFIVDKWVDGQEIILARTELPFPLGEARLEQIVFRFISEPEAVLAALQNGEIDAAAHSSGLTVDNAPALDQLQASGQYQVAYDPGYRWEHIDLNTQQFPLDDVKVRQALYHAIDRQLLIDRLYYGKLKSSDLPLPEFSWAYPQEYAAYPYNPEKARRLLLEAGWDCTALPCTKVVDGEQRELVINLYTNDRPDHQVTALVIQQMWQAINVGVNLHFLYGDGLFAASAEGGPLKSGAYDAASYLWTIDEDPQYQAWYSCNGSQNYPLWCNAEADAQIYTNEIDPHTSLSRPQRLPALQRFFEIWSSEVPVIPLFTNARIHVARPGFVNWKPSLTPAGPDTWNSWEWELYK